VIGAATHADGPALAAWSEARHPEATHPGSPMADALRRWRRGERVGFYTVDRWLCGLGHHVSELPDAVWLSIERTRRPVVRGRF
jgi:hypothetical protein